eukprot:TRINITY_DN27376_c0_g1_i1.p1 TRINITY_DN27376_c0_g1~~TRINITY_DN27376_c0_g1_i1.p1  ORF type:complete len:307 (-),score=30.70 TRINITY_DN27376_c0_g1_i1:49-906(-)
MSEDSLMERIWRCFALSGWLDPGSEGKIILSLSLFFFIDGASSFLFFWPTRPNVQIAFGAIWAFANLFFIAFFTHQHHIFHFPFGMHVDRHQITMMACLTCLVFNILFLFLWTIIWILVNPDTSLSFAWLAQPWLQYLFIASLLAFVCAVLYSRYVEPYWLATRHYTLGQRSRTRTQSRNLITKNEAYGDEDKTAADHLPASPPSTAPPPRIVVISDLHVTPATRDLALLDRVVHAVNQARPDVCVTLGDSLSETDGLEYLQKALNNIQSPFGKFAVKGRLVDRR